MANPRTQDERTAHHEAGHFVIGYKNPGNLYTGPVSIKRKDEEGTLGRTVSEEPWPTIKHDDGTYSYDPDVVEHEVVSLYAGFAAESRFDPEGANPQGSREDDEKAKDWLRYHMNPPTAEVLRTRAKVLVEEYWPAIEALAMELLGLGEVPAEEAEMVVDVALGDATPEDLQRYRRFRDLAEATRGE